MKFSTKVAVVNRVSLVIWGREGGQACRLGGQPPLPPALNHAKLIWTWHGSMLIGFSHECFTAVVV